MIDVSYKSIYAHLLSLSYSPGVWMDEEQINPSFTYLLYGQFYTAAVFGAEVVIDCHQVIGVIQQITIQQFVAIRCRFSACHISPCA